MSHVTGMNESCHTHPELHNSWKSQSLSRVTHMVTHEKSMSHISTSHVTRVNESCHTCEYVTSHISVNHATHTAHCNAHCNTHCNARCNTYYNTLKYHTFACLYACVCVCMHVCVCVCLFVPMCVSIHDKGARTKSKGHTTTIHKNKK